jgi:hypothetical protein
MPRNALGQPTCSFKLPTPMADEGNRQPCSARSGKSLRQFSLGHVALWKSMHNAPQGTKVPYIAPHEMSCAHNPALNQVHGAGAHISQSPLRITCLDWPLQQYQRGFAPPRTRPRPHLESCCTPPAQSTLQEPAAPTSQFGRPALTLRFVSSQPGRHRPHRCPASDGKQRPCPPPSCSSHPNFCVGTLSRDLLVTIGTGAQSRSNGQSSEFVARPGISADNCPKLKKNSSPHCWRRFHNLKFTAQTGHWETGNRQ